MIICTRCHMLAPGAFDPYRNKTLCWKCIDELDAGKPNVHGQGTILEPTPTASIVRDTTKETR